MKRIVLCVMLLACNGIACSSNSEEPSGAPSPELQSTGDTASPAAYLSSFEAVGVELERRAMTGNIGQMGQSWDDAQDVRRDPAVAQFIADIRNHRSNAELLTASSDTAQRYVESFAPIVAELDRQAELGTLDGVLTDLRSKLVGSIEAAAGSDSDIVSSERAKTYCCMAWVGAPTAPEPLACFQWKTNAFWASIKCIGIGIEYGNSHMSGGACNPSECVNM